MKRSFIEIIMNPVRQRIVQFLLLHTTGTTGEMKQAMTDIPPASLYRHIKILLDAGCIEVVKEKKIRGTVEKTYQLMRSPRREPSEEDIAGIFRNSLLSLLATFETYFAKENPDPQRDLLSLTTSTLMLTDAEYMEMTGNIGQVISEVVGNRAEAERKPRRITFISSPCEEDR